MFIRISSPQPKTETTSTSATNNTFVPLPKQEIEEQVEFLDDTTTDPLVHFITGKQTKQEEDGNEFEDPNQEMTGMLNELIDFFQILILSCLVLSRIYYFEKVS